MIPIYQYNILTPKGVNEIFKRTSANFESCKLQNSYTPISFIENFRFSQIIKENNIRIGVDF